MARQPSNPWLTREQKKRAKECTEWTAWTKDGPPPPEEIDRLLDKGCELVPWRKFVWGLKKNMEAMGRPVD